jgi:CRP-like cAMP-binding protein
MMQQALFDFLSKYIDLTEEEKRAVSEMSLFKTYPKDTVLVRAGEITRTSFLVLKGCIRVYYLIEGEEKTTAFYTEGDPFEPVSTSTKKPSEYYVACIEDCILSIGTPDSGEEVFEKFPRFNSVCRKLSEELLIKNQVAFDDFKNSTPEQRYVQLFESRPDLIQRVPQYQLASYLGVKPESLSRIKKRLIKKA